ncbi:Hypothetical predicted protein, partial [Pelobates cultripes]
NELPEFIESNIIEKSDETDYQTSDPNNEGFNYCSNLISLYFTSLDIGSTTLDGYSKVCGYEYSSCENEDKRTCACPTLTDLARISGNQGCSDGLKSWRYDENIVCAMPECPETQIYDECAPLIQPTCSNPKPFQEKGVVSGCVCPEGLVIDDLGGSSICIPISDCPCVYAGQIYKSGEIRKSICNSQWSRVTGGASCGEICKVFEETCIIN